MNEFQDIEKDLYEFYLNDKYFFNQVNEYAKRKHMWLLDRRIVVQVLILELLKHDEIATKFNVCMTAANYLSLD